MMASITHCWKNALRLSEQTGWVLRWLACGLLFAVASVQAGPSVELQSLRLQRTGIDVDGRFVRLSPGMSVSADRKARTN